MTITVETGAIVAGANSYVALADVWEYAQSRGVTLPADDVELEAVVLQASDYLESFGPQFRGERVERDQPLSWPRSGVEIDGWPWDGDEIPRQVLDAQLALIVEIVGGEDPYNPSAATLPVIRERVEGAVEVEYAAPNAVPQTRKTLASRKIITRLLRNSGAFAIRA